MANQEQNPPQQEQPFVTAKQVRFNLEDILLNTNNEVAPLYPEHTNKDTFKCVSDFISKCCLKEPFTRSLNMYREYLAEFWYSTKALENSKVSFFVPTGGIYSEVGVNTFRNAIGAHYLAHSREYVASPSIDIVRPWFETIGYGETVPAKRTLKKSLLPPRWRLLMAHIIQCLGGKTGGFDKITNKDAIILYSLANRINIDYASIFWEDIIIKLNKRHREKVVPYTRFLSLLMMHKMKEAYGDGKVTPYPTQLSQRYLKLLKPFSNAERVPKAQRLELNLDTRSIQLLQNNPLCPVTSASTLVVAEMHKEDQQATGGPTSLGVTSEERADPQLSSGMSAFNLNEPIFSSSFIIHSESASGNDASVVSTAEFDPGKSAPSDFVPQQHGMNEETKNTSYDHLFAGTDPHVLADKTQSVSEGLETVLTQPIIGKRANSIARQVKEDEASRTIKLEYLAKLVSSVQPSFKDLDSPKDDPIIVVDDIDEDEEANEVHATTNIETEDTLVPKSSSPSSLPTKLKELPSKFNELTEEVKGLKNQVHNLEIELPGKLKEIPTKLEDVTKTVTSLTSQVAELKTLQWELPAEFLSVPTQVEVIQAKLKILDALLSLLHKVTNALNQFSQAMHQRKLKITVFLQQDKLALNLLRGRRTQIKPPSLSYSKEKLQRMQT
ncbi:hypothetical protein Tco_0442566 [Tanacetum coccineum]